MGKYDFIKEGNVLFWHDPDNGLSDGVYQVVSVPEIIEDDSIILIAASGSEAEVYPTELSPINSGRSYKEAFLRWKAERKANGKVFYDRLSEVMDTDCNMKVGDKVIFTNDAGLVYGPYEVLAFDMPDNDRGRCVYIDHDSYWLSESPDDLLLVQKKEYVMTKDDKYLWRLCKNIIAGRFNWRRYCSQQSYYGREICVTPLFCSYGQIGYTVYFPYSGMPDVEYDWDMRELTIDEMDYRKYFEQEQD